MITLYTPATGFPDLEVKIAYGLARVGIEVYGLEKISIQNEGGFYIVKIQTKESALQSLSDMFNRLCRRLLSSPYIPFTTPGVAGRSAGSIAFVGDENFSLDIYRTMTFTLTNRRGENLCRHEGKSVGNIIGLAVSTSFHKRRDGLDIQLQPKDKSSPKLPRRPTNPKNICKSCALLAFLGTWFASFIFNVKDRREVIAIPIPEDEIGGLRLQEVFSLQHQIRKVWIPQELPQVLIPLVFLSKIPSSADILDGFNLFIAVLSRQQGYHVDGLFFIPIGNILNFLKADPYNTACVDTMLRREAYSSLQELSQVINHKDKASLSKFARLYVQETSSKWTNLLYSKTSKYLLKEVAMIRQDIIENEALRSMARTLRYFVRERKYQYVDGIRNAGRESRDFEEIVVKMLREGRLRLEQKEKIHLPEEDEIKEVFKLANENFEDTKTTLAILALSFPTKVEETEETLEEVK